MKTYEILFVDKNGYLCAMYNVREENLKITIKLVSLRNKEVIHVKEEDNE